MVVVAMRGGRWRPVSWWLVPAWAFSAPMAGAMVVGGTGAKGAARVRGRRRRRRARKEKREERRGDIVAGVVGRGRGWGIGVFLVRLDVRWRDDRLRDCWNIDCELGVKEMG